MARPQLSALLEPRGNEDTIKVGDPATADVEPTPPRSAPEPAQITKPEPQPVQAATEPKRAQRPRASTPQKPAESVPPYLRFERKEARLRTDQLTDLTLSARQLNKTKNSDADRITDNTLIRVAVDLLLSRSNELAGGDEAALRKSLGI